ncbi:RagB/SusD family nutrient uptake outer membrane protein [Pontibacter sp. G13]|uniref:RagB/SusD family nutrient uptake outer membrane protein n=1 Tax=Pontibacter sp. G13 TaxID=3074898 RepID=UPI0028891C62|nr:RagB/SusD family nutrient uptake outer membrane protein [Pontibacter sp. G13]WNJ16558.1 RagB/SusD family nutrient uptake outer membrane protein [Pontibacter sp. G13]
MNKQIITILLLMPVLLLQSACEQGGLFGDDEFLDIANPNKTTLNSFWRSRNDAFSGVMATYSALQSPSVMGGTGMLMRACLSGDEGQPRAFNEADQRDQLYTFNYNSNTVFVNEMWEELYTGVFRANQVIKNVPTITTLDADEMATFVAEAKFLRGVFYFWLSNFYNEGNIPLVTQVATTPDEIYTDLSDRSAVIAQIVQDLEEARIVLPASWDETNKGRATWGAATAMLGKVHLYQENWTEAAALFQEVINSGVYSLVADPFQNFNIAGEHNSESIFEVGFAIKEGSNASQRWAFDTPAGAEGTYRGRQFANAGPMAGWHSFMISGTVGAALILDTLDTSNPMNAGRTYSVRSEASIGFQYDGLPYYTVTAEEARHNNTATGIVAKKYQNWELTQEDIITNSSAINERVIRLADVYLMYAEAIVERDGMVSQEAVDYLNMVRERAGVSKKIGPADDPTNPSFATRDQFIEYLFRYERLREFCLEGMGIRFLDLRRKGMYGETVEQLSDEPGFYRQPSWKNVQDPTGLTYNMSNVTFKNMSARRFNNYNPNEVFHHWLPLPSEEVLANILLQD